MRDAPFHVISVELLVAVVSLAVVIGPPVFRATVMIPRRAKGLASIARKDGDKN
jgi:hypothetical protein